LQGTNGPVQIAFLLKGFSEVPVKIGAPDVFRRQIDRGPELPNGGVDIPCFPECAAIVVARVGVAGVLFNLGPELCQFRVVAVRGTRCLVGGRDKGISGAMDGCGTTGFPVFGELFSVGVFCSVVSVCRAGCFSDSTFGPGFGPQRAYQIQKAIKPAAP
jgi:hypothetical protein